MNFNNPKVRYSVSIAIMAGVTFSLFNHNRNTLYGYTIRKHLTEPV